MPDLLPKQYQDGLIIIRFEIESSVAKPVITWLVDAGYIVARHGGGWMATSKGREYVRRLK